VLLGLTMPGPVLSVGRAAAQGMTPQGTAPQGTAPQGAAAPGAQATAPRATTQQIPEKRLMVVPPLQWDETIMTPRPVQRHMASDFARLTGGIIFGMNASEVGASLPDQGGGRDWFNLPLAAEFPEDVRYFFVRPSATGDLGAGVATCVGEQSYVVFLFRGRGLFRISFRLFPDATCPSVKEAAVAVMARYATLDPDLVLATHYQNGIAEVVDLVDPGSGHLRTIRWQQRRR